MIHPTAVVDPGARIHESVKIGPYSVIGPDVEIDRDTEIQNHVTIQGPTKIGPECRFYPYGSIGLDPQDKKFHGEKSRLEIGEANTFREFVTVNRGTADDKGVTIIGNRNWIMAYCHIAHDCVVGDDNIFSNGATLAGHVTIGNHVVSSGYTAVHQFCSIGDYAMLGAMSMVVNDVTPYLIVNGQRAQVAGINKVGLERNGFTKEQIQDISRAFKIVFRKGLGKQEALELLRNEYADAEHITRMSDFIAQSVRGICR